MNGGEGGFPPGEAGSFRAEHPKDISLSPFFYISGAPEHHKKGTKSHKKGKAWRSTITVSVRPSQKRENSRFGWVKYHKKGKVSQKILFVICSLRCDRSGSRIRKPRRRKLKKIPQSLGCGNLAWRYCTMNWPGARRT
jgi:hypothetical protein